MNAVQCQGTFRLKPSAISPHTPTIIVHYCCTVWALTHLNRSLASVSEAHLLWNYPLSDWFPKVNFCELLWQNFYRPDALPVTQPTSSECWRMMPWYIWNDTFNSLLFPFGWHWRLKVHIALHGNPSQSYGASLAIWDHTVLPATRQVNAPTPASWGEASTWFTYPGGMEGWVDLGSLLAADRESNPWLLDRKSEALTITPPRIGKVFGSKGRTLPAGTFQFRWFTLGDLT